MLCETRLHWIAVGAITRGSLFGSMGVVLGVGGYGAGDEGDSAARMAIVWLFLLVGVFVLVGAGLIRKAVSSKRACLMRLHSRMCDSQYAKS
jgi:hypothetical protein